jgi:hypothetical protein
LKAHPEQAFIENALKTHLMPSHVDIDPADWILCASLRDRDNWFFEYQSETDDFAGITMPNSLANFSGINFMPSAYRLTDPGESVSFNGSHGGIRAVLSSTESGYFSKPSFRELT